MGYPAIDFIVNLHIRTLPHLHINKNELLGRIELPTSSLPRKCSTTELQQLTQYLKELLLRERETRLEPATYSLEGCRSTNWATPAYLIPFLVKRHKWTNSNILLLPEKYLNWTPVHCTRSPVALCGQRRIRTSVLVREQIYSLSPLATRPSTHLPNQKLKISIQKQLQLNFIFIFLLWNNSKKS